MGALRIAPARTVVLAFSTLLSGCGEPDPGDSSGEPRITASDSAGIPVLVISGQRWGPGEAWRVDPAPVLEIGAGGPDQELFRVRGAVRLPSGAVVVANAGTGELRWFGPDGAFVRSAGGEGEGPGEFTAMWGVARRGDTLYAHDFMEGRVERFDTAGLFIDGVSLPRDDGLPMKVFPVRGGYLALHLRDFDLTGEWSLQRRIARYVHYDSTGEVLVEFARLPGEEMVSRGGGDADQSWVVGGAPMIGHRQWEALAGDVLVAGVTDEWALRAYEVGSADAPTELARILRSPERERPVTDDDVERVNREAFSRREEITPEFRRTIEERWEVAPPPEVRPTFTGMAGDSEGFVWLRSYLPDAEAAGEPWLVVDPLGDVLGDVLLPKDLTVYEIGVDYVLGSVRDEMDMQLVRLYRLRR